MDIELKLLRSLVTIFELGSISRAAEHLHCTQAAMSMRLKLLEEQVGKQLFERHHHRIEPTPFASELYAKALAVLASYDELVSATRARRQTTTIRVGVPDDYALSIFSNAIRGLGSALDNVELDVTCELSANLFAAFHRQDLDIALVTLASPPIGARFGGEARLSWVHHPDFRRSADQPVLLSVYPEGCVFRRAMITALDEARVPWRVAVQSTRQAGVLSAVRSGLGITSMALGTVPGDLVASDDWEGLPPLGTIPIYFMRAQAVQHPCIDAIEAALKGEFKVAQQAA